MMFIWTLLLTVFDIGIGEDAIITTRGCTIPKYDMEFRDDSKNLTCGKRYVTIRKVSEQRIQLVIKKYFDSCCYSYIHRSKVENLEDRRVTLSKCKVFKNKAIIPIVYDFIKVSCGLTDYSRGYAIHFKYNDYYALAKQVKSTSNSEEAYNVLLLGIHSMSRSRMFSSMKETVNVLRQNKWLDYRGFNKVSLSPIQNLIAVLTGSSENIPAGPVCSMDLFSCNEMFIWHEYQVRGYVTAYGEDMAFKNNSFYKHSYGFSFPPTNHYMRPLFLAAEKSGSIVCSGHMSSGLQMLNYILDYTRAYRRKKYFGFFWINSFSHDDKQSPKRLDNALAFFLKRLKATKVFDNTFIILFSEHGISQGPSRYAPGSYYDDRLPMLFIHAPNTFKKHYSFQYSNLEVNQHRLVSHYDLYLTLWDILKVSTDENLVPKAEGCPRCKGLFHNIPGQRICTDAGIGIECCTCHDTTYTTIEEIGAMYSVLQASKHISNLASNILTKPCTKCKQISYKKHLRTQFFHSDNGTTYYVVAIVMQPENVAYEVTVAKNINSYTNTFIYDVVTVQLISQYNNTGWCTLDINYEYFCLCEKIKSCSPSSFLLIAKSSNNNIF